jgi:hypothetical protein
MLARRNVRSDVSSDLSSSAREIEGVVPDCSASSSSGNVNL